VNLREGETLSGCDYADDELVQEVVMNDFPLGPLSPADGGEGTSQERCPPDEAPLLNTRAPSTPFSAKASFPTLLD
jgi:hypothetical protein